LAVAPGVRLALSSWRRRVKRPLAPAHVRGNRGYEVQVIRVEAEDAIACLLLYFGTARSIESSGRFSWPPMLPNSFPISFCIT
jgi:hypothetical protein